MLVSEFHKINGARFYNPLAPYSSVYADDPHKFMAFSDHHQKLRYFFDASHPPNNLESLSLDSLSYFLTFSVALSGSRIGRPVRIVPSGGNSHPTNIYILIPSILGFFYFDPINHALISIPVNTDSIFESMSKSRIYFFFTGDLYKSYIKYGWMSWRLAQIDFGYVLSAMHLMAHRVNWQIKTEHPLIELIWNEFRAASKPQSGEWPLFAMSVSASHIENSFGLLDTRNAVLLSDLQARKSNYLLSTEQILYGERFFPLKALEVADQNVPKTPLLPEPLSRNYETILKNRRSCLEFKTSPFITWELFKQFLEYSTGICDPRSLFTHSKKCFPAILVNRVTGMNPGIYFLLNKDEVKQARWSGLLGESFSVGNESHLYYYGPAKRSNNYGIIEFSHPQFVVLIITELENILSPDSDHFYPCLFWEGGALGWHIYLAAEACQMRARGFGAISCNTQDNLWLSTKANKSFSCLHAVGIGYEA